MRYSFKGGATVEFNKNLDGQDNKKQNPKERDFHTINKK